MKLHRRTVLLAALSAGVPGAMAGTKTAPRVEVWKGPACGCCKDWVKHLEVKKDGSAESYQSYR